MPEKAKDIKREEVVELESQVILRIPEEPAKQLREAIQEGVNNLKERLTIRLESDVRYGEVRFDNYLMHAKVVDLPTILESAKTIDSKSFYKTADVCQMILCKFEPDAPTTEDESPNKNQKKKDPNKVDKKFLWPHGVTPPCKNIRKRRFRKTLRKKCVEAPEIEKEVKRLLRSDNEAVSVKWDIINDEDEQKGQSQHDDPNGALDDDSPLSPTASLSDNGGGGGAGGNGAGIDDADTDNKKSKLNKSSPSGGGGGAATSSSAAAGTPTGGSSSKTDGNVQKQQIPRDIDIFGEDVSSSDDDDDDDNRTRNNLNVDLDETSRLSADDSRFSEFSSSQGQSQPIHSNEPILNEFNQRMFGNRTGDDGSQSSSQRFYDSDRGNAKELFGSQPSQENARKINELKRQLDDLNVLRMQKDQEISSIVNQALRQRLQDSLDNILSQILEKQMEIEDLQQQS